MRDRRKTRQPLLRQEQGEKQKPRREGRAPRDLPRRASAALLALALALSNLLALAGLVPRTALASPESVSLTGYSGDGHAGFCIFELESGIFGVCAEELVTDPEVGDTYTDPRPVTECDASMLSGVDPHTYAYAAAHMPLGGSVDAYGFVGTEAQRGAASCVVNVLLQGGRLDEETGELFFSNGQRYGNIYQSVSENKVRRGELPKILALVNDAKSHAGQSGWWDGAALYWTNATSSARQSIVTFAPVTPTGGIELQKESSLPDVTNGNALYSLEGAVYGVYRDESCTEDELVATLTTDAKGHASAEGLEPGTYYLRELAAPAGYARDESVRPVEVSGGAVTRTTCEDVPQTSPVEAMVAKADSEKGAGSPQGDASLAGAEFTVNYYAGSYSSVDELPEAPTRTWVLATGDDGRALLDKAHLVGGDDLFCLEDGTAVLPLGTVTVQETKAPAGYLLSDQEVRLQQITPSEGAQTASSYLTPTFEDEVVRGGVELQKVDHERAGAGAEETAAPLGSATLAGATIEVTNASKESVLVDGREVAPGKVALTLRTDEDGRCASEPDALPYGTYEAREAEPPEGYLRNETWSTSFSIEMNGEVARPCEKGPLEDQVVRGDISFTKADEETQERMAGIPFKVTSLTTGEWHVLVTDENGMVDTSSQWLSHEQETNASDAALKADGTVDEGELRQGAGVWFHGCAGAETAPSDELGALPYDTYRIEELSCASNAGHMLVSTVVSISRNDANLDLGTIDDKMAPREPEQSEPARSDGEKNPKTEGDLPSTGEAASAAGTLGLLGSALVVTCALRRWRGRRAHK